MGWRKKKEFKKLKAIIMNINPLKYFDMNKKIVFECDASSRGTGTVLKKEGKP